jgi:hypothetical protein
LDAIWRKLFLHATRSQRNRNRATQHVDTGHFTGTIRGLHPCATFGEFGFDFDVLLVLIRKTTEQPPTDAADFGGVERQILIFGHFDRDTRIIRKKRRTAENASTWTDTAEQFCLITWTDLAELDAGTERARQITYEITEVDAFVGRKVKSQT